MVGRSSGYIESLPAAVQRRLEFVRGVEEERGELEEQYRAERRALEEKYEKLYGESWGGWGLVRGLVAGCVESEGGGAGCGGTGRPAGGARSCTLIQEEDGVSH